jgi:outer membrane protein assembly factor BamB
MLYCQDNSATYGILANTITSTDWANPSLSGYSAPTPGSLGVGGISGPSGNFNLFGSPDLKPIKSDYSPYDLLGGEMVYINYTIKNVDSANASAFNVSFYADNIFTEKKYVSGLDTNTTTTLNFNATVNGDGPHDLKIIVDSDSNVAESDETNNKLVRTVDVDWATFHQGNDRRGYSSVDTAPITNNTKWVFNTSGRVFSSPIIVNDVVYVGSNDNNLYAINLTNGSKIWNYTTSGWVMSTPAYYNGTIYVGSGQWPQGERKIYAIYTNGSLRWSYTTGDNLGFSSPVISDGILYMGGHDGTLRALYALNGTQIWSYTNGCGGGNAWIENAASVIDNLIYASNNCYGLQIRNIKDGSLVTSVKYGGGLSAAVDGDVIYSIGGNQVYASNRFNGTKIWNATMDENATSEGTGPAIAYGMVYAGDKFYSDIGKTATFFAFNKTDGSQIWNFTTTGYERVRSAPAVAAGVVYFKAEKVTTSYTINYTSAIFALNATNGNLIWKYAGESLAPSSPAITPGSSIMVVGFNMSILAFGTFDLVPLQMNLTPSANITELQNVNINVSVRNNGSIGVGWFNISLLMDGIEQSRQEAQLDFYMTQVYSFNWTAVAGSHNLTIAVDPDNVIQNESSETNNNITTAVNVTAIPPSVTNITPVAGTNFTANSAVEITANVTDNVAVDTVFANITLPNSTSQMLQMFNSSGSIYNVTFSNTTLLDRYNVTIIANDTAGAVNDTETTYFNILAQAGCNISVLIDGVNATSFTNAGEPYNVTVNVTYENGSAFDTTVNAVECNGLNQFALIQSTDSVFSNCDSAIVQTGSDGIVSWTDVPTGGDTIDSVGNYTISIRALNNGTVCDTKNFTVINRSPPAASGEKTTNVPNRGNVEGSNEQILVLFDRISRSRLSGAVAGETFDIVIYDNGTTVGMPATITSGRPTGLNITILNSTGSGIEDATINAIEKSGLNHWALIQFGESNVSSEVTGTTDTDSNGNIRFTIVPTAGFVSSEVDAAIGSYSVRLQAILPNGTIIYNNAITVDRTLPQPSATEAVPNAGLIEGFNEKILILFDRVSKYV